MRAHDLLINKIGEAIDMASELSTHEKDDYAKCVEALFVAREQVSHLNMDRSAECKCKCHTGQAMHCVPCNCYSGNPVL